MKQTGFGSEENFCKYFKSPNREELDSENERGQTPRWTKKIAETTSIQVMAIHLIHLNPVLTNNELQESKFMESSEESEDN